ncbi:MAG: hypothetical protein UT01_C0001G0011 [Candidatus Daviesbacteria bacterium GW2011_GWA1_38_7]|nr:MAG: hypothetical protein UT01_C0001G0011 [Candidatus Daviesbacteria bacterium GW2011_GWA1_38_7]
MSFTDKKTLLIISILLISYTLLFFFKLTEVGPDYDELAFINAAFGCPNPSMFLHLSYPFGNGCLPVMVMPYLGAVHAYVIRAVFQFFEPTLLTLRATNYFLILTSFILILVGLKKILSRNALLIILFLLAFDPQMLLVTRYERTVVIPFLLKSLFVFFLFTPLPYAKYVRPLMLGLIVGLSIFAKLDILFVIGSVALGAIITAYLYKDKFKKFIESLKFSWRTTAYFFFGFFIGITPLLLYISKSWRVILEANKILSSYPGLPEKKILYLLTQFASIQLMEAAFRLKLTVKPSWFLSAFLFLLLIYVTIRLVKKHWLLSILSLSLLFFYAMIIFYKGLGAWGKIHHLILTCGRRNWSCNIYDAMNVLKTNNNEIVVGDWGIATQFLFLSRGQRQINELVFKADSSNPEDLTPVITGLQKNCANFVMSSPEQTIFLKARQNMMPFLEQNPSYSKTVVLDREKHPYLEIYQCK